MVKYALNAGLGNIGIFVDPPARDYGRNVSGYGRRIATRFKVRFDGKGRAYRVFCVIFSNIGSLYIVVKGKNLYLHDYEFSEDIKC